ncbi:MAG: hypothetical protein Q9176_003813 [Flavoplaca citrina]
MAVLYGTLYLFFAAFPIVFREYRGWDETHTGLAFLGIGVGVILGVIYSFLDHAKYAKLRENNDDELGPEARLPQSLVGSIAIPISLFWFAWTITPSIHFMVPLHMYDALGINWASTIPAILATLCVPFPFLFWKYGARIRRRCKYAAQAEEVRSAAFNKLHSSAAPSQEYTEILNLSKTCTTIARQLQTEITKLNLNSGGHRQALSKAVQSIRKGPWLKETQAKLNSCTRTLDTLILIKLDTQSLRSSNDINTVDQRVRDLALRIERGRITTDRLLANQTSQILDHFDQRFDGREGEKRIDQARESFKASLFFPDIEAREDEIVEAFEGTCQWIFDPPTSAESHEKKWHSFREWLETGQNIYWINGKPGAGKSTLMRYIVDEPQTAEYLSEWEPNTDLIIATFFFKNLGSELQKSTTGLLRSLIWQLVRHWPKMIHLVLKRYKEATGQLQESPPLMIIPTWTEKRLLQILNDFADEKPSTVTLCVFIDGLDEYVGDQDTLLHIISLLSSVGGCKVCVSSRPDQKFRSEFQGYPQCRVQDLNQKDIEKMVTDKLKPCLEKNKPNETEAIEYLLHILIDKAEGVFLWLGMMIKDLSRASRHGNTISELHQRLETTPNTMNGLYRRILRSLDKMYLDYALKTFQIMVAAQYLRRRFHLPLTLLDFACMDETSWLRVEQFDRPYFGSSTFQSKCRELHTRLYSRCGNLIDIKDDDNKTNKTNKTNKAILVRHAQTVNFIHRTAVEFLKDEYVNRFSDKTCLTVAWIPLARARIGLVFLFQLTRPLISQTGIIRRIMDEEESPNHKFEHDDELSNDLENLVANFMMAVSFGENIGRNPDPSRPLVNVQSQLTAQVFQTLQHLTTTDDAFHETPDQRQYGSMKQLAKQVLSGLIDTNVSSARISLEDCLKFAAFFGCESYIRSHLSTKTPDDQLEDILTSAVAGIYHPYTDTMEGFPVSHLNIVDLILHLLRILRSRTNNRIPYGESKYWPLYISPWCKASLWGTFIFQICNKARLSLANGPELYGEKEAWVQRCVQVVESFLLEAYLSKETDHYARIGLLIRVFGLGPGGSFALSGDMTPLGCIQTVMQWGHEYLSPIENVLQSKRAKNRFRYRYCTKYDGSLTYHRITTTESKALERLLFSRRYPGAREHSFFFTHFQFAKGDEPLDIFREIFSANGTLDKDTMEEEWARGGSRWLEEED